MDKRKLSCVLLLVMLVGAPLLMAQEDEEDAPKKTSCKPSAILSTIPSCKLTRCEVREYDSAELQTSKHINSEQQGLTTVEGAKEVLQFECDENLAPLQITRNAQNALTASGYSVVFNGKNDLDDLILTMRKGGQWVEVEAGINATDASSSGYKLTTVRTKEMEQYMEASAMESAINQSGRVSVYGINFDTGKATLKPESDKVLGEIAALMKKNADWKMRVEGHTDNVGTKAANQKLSEDRAASVVNWLVAKGVSKGRLTPQGFGDTKPVASNADVNGREKNRRVELVKE